MAVVKCVVCHGGCVMIVSQLLYDVHTLWSPCYNCGSFRDLKMENILLDKRKRNVKIVGKVICHVKEFIITIIS